MALAVPREDGGGRGGRCATAALDAFLIWVVAQDGLSGCLAEGFG